MTRPAVSAAAAAILDSLPEETTFPTLGIIRSIHVTRDDTTGLISTVNLLVGLPDRQEPAYTAYSGAFAAELMAVQSDQSFVGRDVKVELVSGQLITAYTIYGTIR